MYLKHVYAYAFIIGLARLLVANAHHNLMKTNASLCKLKPRCGQIVNYGRSREWTHLVGEEHVVDDGVVSDKLFLLLLHRFPSRSSLLDPLPEYKIDEITI